MPAPTPHATLRRTIQRQQAEIRTLRAQLLRPTALPPPTLPGPELAGFLTRLQELFPAILLVDAQQCVTWASPGFVELCGCSATDLMGQHPGAVLGHARLDAAEQARIAACLSQGESVDYEVPSPHPGQAGRWLRVKVQGYRNQQHELETFIGLAEDSTPARQAEETARYRQLRQVLAAEGLGDGNWEYNCRTQLTVVSPELKILLGYTSDEQSNTELNWQRYTHPDDMPAVAQQWQDFLVGHVAIFRCECRLRCRNGTYRWVLNRALVTKRDAQGQPLLVTGSNIDISASKKVEAALTASALRLSTTIANLQRGVLLVDENQRVVLANNTFCQLFGLSLPPEQLTGMRESEVAQQIKSQFPDEAAFLAYEENTIRGPRPREYWPPVEI
jgi:PAS domain S-box-containing protein